MSIYLPFVGRLKLKPVFSVRTREKIIFRIGSHALVLMPKKRMNRPKY
jgi:hypothetical protein